MNAPISYQKNSFDLIRWYAAFAVMLLHYTGYFAIFSSHESVLFPAIRSTVLFFPGVIALFTLSGFLIASSYERTSDRKTFFRKRIFRLFPELWICTVVNLIVLSVLTAESFDYSIFTWLLTQIFGIANTPSCLKGFATGSVNGALWTIFVELQFYLITMFFYPFFKKLSTAVWTVLLIALAGMNLALGFLSPSMPSFIQKITERTFLPYALWFFAGMFCYIKRTTLLPTLKKACPILIVVYLLLYLVITKQPGYYCGIITGIFCPFITIGLAYLLPAYRTKIDLSYGIFLYHWIILNIMVHFNLMNRLSPGIALLFFMGTTLLLSWGSHILSTFILSKIQHD